jgi:PilX N-terminal
MKNIHSDINRSEGRHFCESRNPEKHWIPGQARNDKPLNTYVVIYNDCLMNQKGIALVVALVMLLVLTFIGFAAVSLTSYEARIAGNERVYNNAFYAGDGGIENFRGRVSTGEFVYSVANSGSYQVAIGDSISNVTYTRGNTYNVGGVDHVDFFVTSEGVSPSFPMAGRVVIESIIEVAMMAHEGYN